MYIYVRIYMCIYICNQIDSWMDGCTLMVSNWEIAALKTKSNLYNNNKKETK